MEGSSKNETPKWLKHLQENSWEAEILISGGAIFSLFQLLDSVSLFIRYLKDIRGIEGTNEIFIFLHLALNGLIIGFICHLILRSLWIALLCLRYAFPDGINFQRLKVQPMYLADARSANLINQIMKLDHLSGLVFFSAISYVIVIIGAILITAIGVGFRMLGIEMLQAYLILCLIFLLDLLSLGVVRRWKILASIYKPLYYLFNYLSLAFIYRAWLQVLFTNISRWKLYLVGVLFLTSSLVLTILTLSAPMHWRSVLDGRKFFGYSDESALWTENFYDNKNTNGLRVSFACIQQDIVSDRFLHVFIPYYSWHDELIEKNKRKNFENIVSLKLDNEIIPSPEWLFGNHFSSNQEGITTYIPIDKLSFGKHVLTVEMKYAGLPFPLTIPFWKQ